MAATATDNGKNLKLLNTGPSLSGRGFLNLLRIQWVEVLTQF
jgi:hypothetical protein